jgi:RNA polymerase sigma factor (sigma-70 family)
MEAGALRAPATLNRISVTAPLLRLRSDEQLVALFRAGNDAAFSVIHDRYRQRLFAYARQMLDGSRQDAEDALQDVFLRAYSSLRDSDRPLSLRAWLYRVAHNRCIDHLRRPIPPAVDLFDTSRKPLHDPIAEAERRDDLRRLVADVRRLPDQQRSALLMREIDGLSYAELGAALGVSLPAVKSLLVRARISLVEAIEARDTDCLDIRDDLADAFERGVRASGLARRHLRDCAGCVEYRSQLRAVRQGFDALTPGSPGPMAGLLKLVGIGGAGSAGAASAGGGAAAGGGAIAAVGGGTAAKVAAVVCCAALTAGGAVEVGKTIKPSHAPAAAKPAAAAAGAALSPALAAHRRAVAASTAAALKSATAAAQKRAKAKATAAADSRQRFENVSDDADAVTLPAPQPVDSVTGGAAAPEEDAGFGHGVDGLTPVTSAKPDDAGSLSAPPASGGYAAPAAESSTVTAPTSSTSASAAKTEYVPDSQPAG